MKNRTINKVAVLGSGVMGSRIACHFANIGVEVLLLDIVPRELSEQEAAKGLTLESKAVRNRIVNDALKSALKSKPAPVFRKGVEKLISTGNFTDDMSKISSCDWTIEVVVENLDIKKKVFEQVEQYRKPGTLITSNTSGIPMKFMCEGRSDDFVKHFCGTHFFNPPRYLRLLEIIPGPGTDQDVVDFLMHYGDVQLGKETVLCKDTPAFIANRIGVYAIMSGMHTIQEMGLSVGEVDKLTGPIIGRAKSATFRTSDVVGLDTMVKVSNNLHAGLPNDESKERFVLPKIVSELNDRQWFGDKTKQGYYKKTKDDNGKKVILELNLNTFEYQPKTRAKFKALEAVKDMESVRERIPVLLNFEDKAGEFYRKSFYDVFRYCSNRIPEIADELFRIDEAVAAGFAWELGPFETWDLLGVKETASKMEEAGEKPADWVYEMLEAGHTSFYKNEDRKRLYYDIPTKSYKVVPGTESLVMLETLRGENVVWGNAGATLFDIGDGVLNLEFHTKMNALGAENLEGVNTAISIAEEQGWKGLVIGNESANFSAGANLAMLFMFACDQEYDEINLMIAQFQKTMMKARYSSVPVVAATSGLALGGGCELSMHCDAIQAHAETYMGLVEVGVGLIPAGGGTKEMALRVSDSFKSGDPEYNRLQDAFMAIATAKVATSAEEMRDMGFMNAHSNITLNRKRVIADAKTRVLEMSALGYAQKNQRRDIKVQGRGGMALFEAGIAGMEYANWASEHDAKIARKLNYVINGGDLSAPALVSEQYLLDLEREAFLSLTGEKKTLERIQSILFKGKPLRN
ncbi:3-hydroxyacyl-CoA dehydrogenase/enoyl-CoA hydratase family protein [Flammeovirga agarivorans]|uniref:3-hydroxyacyl-CoA dehydrogenase/enoyl-CoA hydratase family protein n=1 Tax=Flammeovirga agarivorans TaxID=2726742 RepID=A0A7X8SMX7_9BACT|nr:3-hydroxyacyl-CoA dehydrogenase/enoyl-CoA hydratase family protein [Flammeovirga agarivorans]NLR93130.1 3-hydroxyacyl-CoA dehydrogenase/enoyl-CoA hydratase family protein [Flammeovirga agarivorans]